MRNVIKYGALSVTRSAAFSTCLASLERAGERCANLLRVLTYHRVDHFGARPELSPALISATPAAFEAQMAYLAAHYRAVSLAELLDACERGTALPPRSVLITFDDAYRDFAEHAWPTLKRYGLPVTLFVPTAFPGHSERAFWWDRLHQALNSDGAEDVETPLGRLPLQTSSQRAEALPRLCDQMKQLAHAQAMSRVDAICAKFGLRTTQNGVLDWDDLRTLAREGVTLGAHTQTHPLMNRISVAEARAEAVGSLRDLEREVGPVARVLAYPGGAFNPAVTETLRREGFALAFTTIRGINDLQIADRLRLRRINVGRHTTLGVLRAQLLPWARFLNRLWRPAGMGTGP